MRIYFHTRFEKNFKKLDQAVKNKFMERLEVFAANPFAPQLRNHVLKGPYEGYRSINVTGDFRAVYSAPDNVIFAILSAWIPLEAVKAA